MKVSWISELKDVQAKMQTKWLTDLYSEQPYILTWWRPKLSVLFGDMALWQDGHALFTNHLQIRKPVEHWRPGLHMTSSLKRWLTSHENVGAILKDRVKETEPKTKLIRNPRKVKIYKWRKRIQGCSSVDA